MKANFLTTTSGSLSFVLVFLCFLFAVWLGMQQQQQQQQGATIRGDKAALRCGHEFALSEWQQHIRRSFREGRKKPHYALTVRFLFLFCVSFVCSYRTTVIPIGQRRINSSTG